MGTTYACVIIITVFFWNGAGVTSSAYIRVVENIENRESCERLATKLRDKRGNRRVDAECVATIPKQ